MVRNVLKKILIAFIIFITLLAAWLTYNHGAVLYRTIHIALNAVGSAPGWSGIGGYEAEIFSIRLSDTDAGSTMDIAEKTELHIYRPKEKELSSFMILVPGFTDKGAEDRRIKRLSRAFAESGIGVAVPDTPGMRNRIFDFRDINAISAAFNYLQQQNYVMEEKIAICGFSIAGSYSVIAASRSGNEPVFVVSFGGYYDLAALSKSVLTGRVFYKDKSRKWIASDIPGEVVSKMLGMKITPGEYTVEEAARIMRNLSSEKKELLKRVSPSSYKDDISTKLYIFHSSADDSIPVEESRKLAENLRGKTQLSITELEGLSHVTPKDFLSRDYLRLTIQIFKMISDLSEK